MIPFADATRRLLRFRAVTDGLIAAITGGRDWITAVPIMVMQAGRSRG